MLPSRSNGFSAASPATVDSLPTRRSLLSRLHNLGDSESWRVFFETPTGLDANDKVGWSVDAAGAAAAGAEEASQWNYRFNPRATSPSAGTAVGLAGKTTAVISVAWKAAEFINDASEATTKMINEAAPRIGVKQQHACERLKVLKQATAKLNRTNQKVLKGDTRSLAELNAAIQRQERINRRTAAQARYWEAKARKAQQ